MDSISSRRAERLRRFLAEQKRRLREQETQMVFSVLREQGFLSEAQKHKTPSPVRRCVASVINKGERDVKRSVDDVSDDEKSRAFAICWDSYNKGKLTRGFGGKKGKERKGQYKALLKNPKPE